MELIKRYGKWFIQFQRFSYIRIQGFVVVPIRMPRYPMKKLIFLELTRQMVAFETILQYMHRKWLGDEFTLRIGTMEACPSLQSAQHLEKEKVQYELYSHNNRDNLIPMEKHINKPT